MADKGLREWSGLLIEEFYVFTRAVLYIGIYKEPQIRTYWNTDFNKGLIHTIASHITLRYFEQIKRYC